MRKVIVALVAVCALLVGTTVGLVIDMQPVPDKFVFWGTSNVRASPLIVTEYELEREVAEITSVKVTVTNTDSSGTHWGVLEVDVISGDVIYFGKTTIPSVPPDGSTTVDVTFSPPAPVNGLTNVHFYLVDD